MKKKKLVIGLCVGLCLVLGACKMGTEENHEDAYGDTAGSVHLTTMESAVIASQEDVKREAADEAINTNKTMMLNRRWRTERMESGNGGLSILPMRSKIM